MMDRTRLRPLDIAVRAETSSRRDFVSFYRDDPFLLVCLDDQDDGLVDALMECPTEEGREWFPRSESTGTGTVVASPSSGWDPSVIANTNVPLGASEIREVLATAHFALPLRKRPKAMMADPERISVGRSQANDIVLFHASVSKMHAWIERDERGRHFVWDAGSTNQTRVEGQVITPSEFVFVPMGRPIRFGEVTTRICEADVLWEALR